MLGPCEHLHLRNRLIAKPALGLIDDPFKRQIIGGLIDQPQISERIADFGALIKAEAADNLVRHPDADEALFKFARLKLRANEDRAAVKAVPGALMRFDHFANAACFLWAIPYADDVNLLTLGLLRP